MHHFDGDEALDGHSAFELRFALETYRAAVDRHATPSFEEQEVRCVFGILSYWLENVADPNGARKAGLWSDDDILDEKLFEQNVGYGKSVADLNLLTYLIHHGDSHDQQFLISKDRLRPHVYSVDNSVAFESIKNPMLLFRTDWSNIQVPAVSRHSIARLRSLGEQPWERLAIIEQYRARGDTVDGRRLLGEASTWIRFARQSRGAGGGR